MRKFLYSAAIGLAAAALMTTGALAAEKMPGEGKTVKMARATWDTGWFQAEIYRQALEKLGYKVAVPTTLDNPPFYQAVGQGDIDLWVNGWFPLHDSYSDAFKDGAEKVGYVAKGGALQGYLIDKKTADKYHITNLADMKKPEIKKLFDSNGDGKADLVACPPGWGCEKKIAEQLDTWKLRDDINPIKAAYSASMADAVGRFKEGKSILFYTWTPNWTVGVLKPGKDVVWIEAPEADAKTTVAGVEGCVADPCKLGWEANDIRPVANKKFLKDNPAVKTLLEKMSIPLKDIFAQNAKMNDGEDKPKDIEKHAADWIKAHQEEFDGWIEAATASAS
jgi:glycine betaine/proline transport system substrate-binding protein